MLITLLIEYGHPCVGPECWGLFACEHILVFVKQLSSVGLIEGGGVPSKCEAVPAIPFT